MTHFRSDQMTEMRKVNKLAPNFCFYRKNLSIKMSHEEKAREDNSWKSCEENEKISGRGIRPRILAE